MKRKVLEKSKAVLFLGLFFFPPDSSICNSELVISFHFHIPLKVKLNAGNWHKDVISSRNKT